MTKVSSQWQHFRLSVFKTQCPCTDRTVGKCLPLKLRTETVKQSIRLWNVGLGQSDLVRDKMDQSFELSENLKYYIQTDLQINNGIKPNKSPHSCQFQSYQNIGLKIVGFNLEFCSSRARVFSGFDFKAPSPPQAPLTPSNWSALYRGRGSPVMSSIILQHGEVRDTNLAWVGPVFATTITEEYWRKRVSFITTQETENESHYDYIFPFRCVKVVIVIEFRSLLVTK